MQKVLSKTLLALAFLSLVQQAPAQTLKPVFPEPKPVPVTVDPTPLDVGKYLSYSIDGHTGPITWEIEGSGAGFKECAKALTLFGLVQNTTEPGEYEIPANAVILWGKTPGVVKLHAFGVVEGRAKRLLSKSFVVGGSVPIPDPIDPVNPIEPGKRIVLIVEETADAAANRAAVFADKGLRDYIAMKAHLWRCVDKDVVDGKGQTPKDLVPWIEKSKSAGIPRLFITTDKGKILYEGNVPTTADGILTQLKKVGG